MTHAKYQGDDNMRWLLIGVAAAAAINPSIASAEASANEILKGIDSGRDAGHFTSWLTGHANALLWVNAILANRGDPMLFCQPPKLATTTDQDLRIFRDYVRDHPTEGKNPAGFVFIEAFQATFPCPPK
jgi:hypothetical protein